MQNVDQLTPPVRDPVEVLLGRIVWETLRRSLLGSAALAAGCSAGGGLDEHDDAAGAVQTTHAMPKDAVDPCVGGALFPVLASGLTLQEAHDYAAVRQTSSQLTPQDAGSAVWGRTDFQVISETGSACATATDSTCSETVQRHPNELTVESCGKRECYEWSVVTTQGNEVERAATPGELLALLGAIDSRDDALLLVAVHQYDVTCSADDSLVSPTGSSKRWVREVPGGYELVATRYANLCPVVVRRFRLFVANSGDIEELEQQDFSTPAGTKNCIGRVPAGLVPRAAQRSNSTLGEHLAACAHLEAASVHAFVRLADELCAHGAPRALVERALAAAQDEVRHARTVSALARLHEGELTTPQVSALPLRSLEEIARENAVEGCVRETYGALVGAHQAARAHDPVLRQAMTTIAADEARHAALSHDVDAWLMTTLDEAARGRVRDAQRRAIDELFAAAAREPEPLLQQAAGLPDADTSHELLRELARELWQVSLA